jgi:hypothetical protein
MGWIARLFGREKAASTVVSGGSDPLAGRVVDGDSPALPQPSLGSTQIPQDVVRSAVQHALAPVVSELQGIRRELDGLLATRRLEPGQASSGDNAIADQASLERAIENALAYFYRLLRGREEFKVPAAILGQTADGNTVLPLDPIQQHMLIIMNPLYPHLYTTLIVLPATFTRVDALHRLPNGVQTYALHINTRKAPPGLMDALIALHRENSDNLFLGLLTIVDDDTSKYKLQYFRCTGSEIRNPAPDRFPEDMMIYFNGVPEPFILRQSPVGVEDVFSALERLEQDVAVRPALGFQQGMTTE